MRYSQPSNAVKSKTDIALYLCVGAFILLSRAGNGRRPGSICKKAIPEERYCLHSEDLKEKVNLPLFGVIKCVYAPLSRLQCMKF